FTAEVHCSGNTFNQVFMWQTIFQRTQQWLDQTVACAQFTQRLTAYALYIIFQIRVLKTTKDFLDVRRMFVRVKTVTLNQYRAAFFHRPFYHRADFRVENRITNGLMTRQFSEVRGYSMTRVQGEEFTFDKCHQVVG